MKIVVAVIVMVVMMMMVVMVMVMISRYHGIMSMKWTKMRISTSMMLLLMLTQSKPRQGHTIIRLEQYEHEM